MIKQPVLEKGNSELKLVVLNLKIDPVFLIYMEWNN